MILELTNEHVGAKTPISSSTFPPEIQLLVCCARTSIDTATALQIQSLLQSDLDWACLLQQAVQHGVLLLLYENLKKTHPELIPQTSVLQLHNYCQIKTARNLFLTQELLQILDRLARHGISVIPFKGPTLAALAYGNLALREFCDLDLLVHKDDFLNAKDFLIRQGYRHKHFGDQEAACAQAQLLRDDGKVGIDLHYGITPRDFFFPLDSEPFWERLQPLPLLGKTVATLSPEDSLLVAYIHGSKESWTSLKRICDLAELMRTYPQIDWEQIVEQVHRLGNERSFVLSLLIASHHLRVPLPKAISQRTKGLPKLQFLAEQQYKWLFSEPAQPPLIHLGGIDLFQMARKASLGSRVYYSLCVALRVNEKDRAILPLPAVLSFLYYPLRLLRLIKTYKLGRENLGLLWTFLTK